MEQVFLTVLLIVLKVAVSIEYIAESLRSTYRRGIIVLSSLPLIFLIENAETLTIVKLRTAEDEIF